MATHKENTEDAKHNFSTEKKKYKKKKKILKNSTTTFGNLCMLLYMLWNIRIHMVYTNALQVPLYEIALREHVVRGICLGAKKGKACMSFRKTRHKLATSNNNGNTDNNNNKSTTNNKNHMYLQEYSFTVIVTALQRQASLPLTVRVHV